MTEHINDERSTSNDQSDNHSDSDIGPTSRLHDTENVTEICLIDLDGCTVDVIYWHLDSDGPGGITFSYDGALSDEEDLKAAVGQVYTAMYCARQELGSQLSTPKVRPKLFRSLAVKSPVTAEYKIAQLLSKAAARGIQDANMGLPDRSKAEITYRLMIPESHLDISGAEPV
jgi:hypothetical protein